MVQKTLEEFPARLPWLNDVGVSEVSAAQQVPFPSDDNFWGMC